VDAAIVAGAADDSLFCGLVLYFFFQPYIFKIPWDLEKMRPPTAHILLQVHKNLSVSSDSE
jgi:hypothetical protein